jgi:hypothetical protein
MIGTPLEFRISVLRISPTLSENVYGIEDAIKIEACKASIPSAANNHKEKIA